MSTELLAALAVFAFVSSATPGPNNLMLMASGANFGFARTIPHMLGISFGFAVMIFLVGAGLMQVFNAYPISHAVLKMLGIFYMCYLAWKIATAVPKEPGAGRGRPMSFAQAAAFQWVNPKAWTMALTALSAYAPEATLKAFATVAFVFCTVNLPAVSLWTGLGQQMSRLLTRTSRLLAFNRIMAGLLLASLYPVLIRP